MSNETDETIQLVIDAKNIATEKLNAATKDLDELGKAAEDADKDLAKLEVNQATISSYREMSEITRTMKRELAESEVKYKALTKAVKSNTNVTEEQLVRVEQVKQALKEERTAVASQVKAYELKKKQVKELGVHSQNYAKEQEKLNKKIKEATTQSKKLNDEYAKVEKTTDKIVKAEKERIASLDKQIAANKKAADAAEKKATADKKVTTEQKRVTAQLVKYEKELRELNKEKQDGVITTGKYIKAEEKLRQKLKLSESQAKSTRRALEADAVNVGKRTKSTDLLTTATRRLAQAYTVLLAAQKATEAVGASVKGYGELEAAITKVEKTTGIARDQVVAMGDDLREFAEEVSPTATNELLRFAEVAGQMGVDSTDDIMQIVVAADALGVATNLAGEEAATLSARILGMTGEGVQEIHEFASALVELGNSTKTTEDEILHMTKEIVTGTNALGFGSAAAAGFGATLKELGQPAERSRSAMQDLSTVILDLAADGTDGLEKLINITGLTAEAIEEGLGKEPEQIVIRFVEGLKKAKDGGVTLKTSLAGVGITSKETNAVVGALAENTERLSEVVGLSSDAYQDGTKHIDEAAKRYADQESVLLRLVNRFTTLKTKIGEAYAPSVISTVDTLSDALDENQDSIVDVMRLIPELVEGIVEMGEAFETVSSAVIKSDGIVDDVLNGWSIAFNGISVLLKSNARGILAAKKGLAEFLGASERELLEYDKRINEISGSIADDMIDIARISERLAGTSTLAFENLTDTLRDNKDAFETLTDEEKKTITTLIEHTKVNKNLNGEYDKYAAKIARAAVALKTTAKAQEILNKQKSDSKKLIVDNTNLLKDEQVILSNYVASLSDVEEERRKGNITDEIAKGITDEINKSIEKQKEKVKTLVDVIEQLRKGKEKLNITDEKANKINEETEVISKERVDRAVELNNAQLNLIKQQEALTASYEAGNISLLEYNTKMDESKSLYDVVGGLMLEMTDNTEEASEAVRELSITENGLVKTIKELKEALKDENTEASKKALLTLQLKTAEESLLETQEKKALVQEIEGKNAKQLQIQQKVVLDQLEILDKQYKNGGLTLKEYTDKTESLNVEAQLLSTALDKVKESTDGVTESQKLSLYAANNLARSEKLLADRIEHTNEVRGAANALGAMFDRAMERSKGAYDSTGKSVEELREKLVDLSDEMTFLNRNTMPSNLAGMDLFINKLDDLGRTGVRIEETTVRQTLKLNQMMTQVDAGTISMESLGHAANNANYYFSNLSDNQLAPLRAAIKSAKAEFSSLSDAINDTFEDVQDRLDELLGNESDILKRKFAKEMAEMEELLTQATESGDRALIRKINTAISNLRKAQGIETKNANTATESSVNTLNDNTSTTTSKNEYNVKIELPNGSTQTVEVVSSSDADTLVSALSALGEVNIDGVG